MVGPVEIEGADGLGFFSRLLIMPGMRPDIDGRRAAAPTPALLHVLGVGLGKAGQEFGFAVW